MREIIFDTETTGLDSSSDRIVEFGAVELVNRFPTGRSYHAYFNPAGRQVHPEALEVHGLSDAFLADKPTFADKAPELMAFLDGGILVAHNASFDMKFLNAELRLCGFPVMPFSRAVDTLELARSQFPGAQNSLDALCRRFRIDNSNRTLHGALLDSELLAEVYLALRGGRQPGLVLETGPLHGASGPGTGAQGAAAPRGQRPRPLAPRITEAEAQAHAAFVAKLGEKAVWLRYRDVNH